MTWLVWVPIFSNLSLDPSLLLPADAPTRAASRILKDPLTTAHPCVDKELPTRKAARKDTELPIVIASSTEQLRPTRVPLATDTLLLNRKKLADEIELPKNALSKLDTVAPTLL